jgi:transcriptional regulator with XRE-family HTH domain
VTLLEDIKAIIAENIVQLRRKSGMTQIELAEKLNYSDKAVSKWERGESVPDISVLKNIADMFGVTVDYLITAEHSENECVEEDASAAERILRKKRLHVMVMGMSILLVWLIAAVIFVPIDIATTGVRAHWLAFLYAIPTSMLIWLIFNAIWFDRRRNYLIISLMVWTLIAAIHITVLMFGYNIWQFYLLGIPGQLIIILWSKIGKKS